MMFRRSFLGDGPIIGRINPFGGGSSFGQVLPLHEPLPMPSETMRSSAIEGLLDPPSRPPSLQEALDAVGKELIDIQGGGEEQAALLGQWFSIRERVEKFVAGTTERRRTDLESQLAQVREEGRACDVALQAARAEVSQLQVRWNAGEEGASRARAQLMAVRDGKLSDDAWPTDEELESQKCRLADAEAEADRWRVSQDALMAQLETATAKAREIARRLAGLRERRDDLRAQLDGRERKGPLGLTIPASR